jgi:hypothetical protein
MRVVSAWLLAVLALAGCSSNDVIAQLPEEDTAVDEADSAELDSATETSADTTTPADTAAVDSTAPDTKPETTIDTATSDMGPVDIGTTFPCGSEMCGSSLQFCRRATSPGICPAPDSGICPAGCPGCMPLSLKCENLPTKCWAKPSCSCILVEICGSPAAGDCVEKDSGFTAGCHGV